MPDEPAWGHARRFAWLNGTDNPHAVWAEYCSRKSYSSYARFRWLDGQEHARYFIQPAADEELASYTRSHSMAGLLLSTLEFNALGENFHWRRLFSQHGGVARGNGNWRSCHLCATEDLATVGSSWLRRVHQLAGVQVCLAHGVALRTWKRQGPLERSAHLWPALTYARSRPPRITPPGSEDPTVQRYRAILKWVCMPARPDRWHAVRYAHWLGDRSTNNQWRLRRYLVRIGDELAPDTALGSWFRTHFQPVLRPFEDRSNYRAYETCGYQAALAVALLYPCEGEMWSTLFEGEAKPARGPSPGWPIPGYMMS